MPCLVTICDTGEEEEIREGGGKLLRSDMTSGCNPPWEWLPDTGDADDGKSMSEGSRCGSHDSQERLIFADMPEALS